MHDAVRSAFPSKSIFYTKKRCLLDHKSKYNDFVSAKYVPMVWAMKGDDSIPSPADSEADAKVF
jgi:hypothetical protein